MSVSWQTSLNSVKSIISSVAIGAVLFSCALPESEKSITIDGSSSVYPITKAAVDQFLASSQKPVDISVDISGTSGGFRKFCEGKTDINDASRPIQADEMALCRQNNVSYIELPIAFDALSVVVNPNNNWISTITTQELKKIWEPAAGGKITRWNQVRESFPDQPIKLFGPDKDSGTFDYFTEAIVGKAGVSRKDYIASEDDNLIVEGVQQDTNGIGYFGLSYYEAHKNELKALAVDGGKGATLPSLETVTGAKYQPLARPLFIYVNLKSAQENNNLKNFIGFYLKNAPEIVKGVDYIPLTSESYSINEVTFYHGEVGTVFNGKSQFDLTLPELQRKQAALVVQTNAQLQE